MEILKKGSSGQSVKNLQNKLNRKGYPVSADGVFGQQTYISVCRFQKNSGLFADGIVGAHTWKVLDSNNNQKETGDNEINKKNGTIKTGILDFDSAAKALGIDIAAIKAVHEIESGGRSGFLNDGRPVILFEGHIFWQELKKRGIDPGIHYNSNSDILFPRWNKIHYRGGPAEYERLEKACIIHKEAALCSASWGMFQIMGFNYRLCGFHSVEQYTHAIKENENNHLLSFVNFLKNTNMAIYLQRLDWRTFASKYNGSGYKRNRYDDKLRTAYLKHKKNQE